MSTMNEEDLRRAKFYADLHKLAEDDRIALIGEYVMQHDDIVSIVTDSDHGKADRYVEKLTTRFPYIEVYERGDGPIAKAVYFKVRQKGH